MRVHFRWIVLILSFAVSAQKGSCRSPCPVPVLGREAELAVPTPDHYLPLLYIAGTRTSYEPVTFPVEGVDGGSVSMLAVRIS